jgi:hypothetical protein
LKCPTTTACTVKKGKPTRNVLILSSHLHLSSTKVSASLHVCWPRLCLHLKNNCEYTKPHIRVGVKWLQCVLSHISLPCLTKDTGHFTATPSHIRQSLWRPTRSKLRTSVTAKLEMDPRIILVVCIRLLNSPTASLTNDESSSLS